MRLLNDHALPPLSLSLSLSLSLFWSVPLCQKSSWSSHPKPPSLSISPFPPPLPSTPPTLSLASRDFLAAPGLHRRDQRHRQRRVRPGAAAPEGAARADRVGPSARSLTESEGTGGRKAQGRRGPGARRQVMDAWNDLLLPIQQHRRVRELRELNRPSDMFDTSGPGNTSHCDGWLAGASGWFRV